MLMAEKSLLYDLFILGACVSNGQAQPNNKKKMLEICLAWKENKLFYPLIDNATSNLM